MTIELNQEPTLGSKENPIFVETKEDFDRIKNYKYIKFFVQNAILKIEF